MQLNFKGNFTKNEFTNDGLLEAQLILILHNLSEQENQSGGVFFLASIRRCYLTNDQAPSNPVALLDQTQNNADVNR